MLSLFATPGFITSIFQRDNEFFYLPFQVNFSQYIGNLISMNGLIQVLIASSGPLILFLFRNRFKSFPRSKNFICFYLSAFPFLFTLSWMMTLKQATDHHMVQWVPTYFALCSLILLHLFLLLRKSKMILGNLAIVTFAIVVLTVSTIPFFQVNTPFASPVNPLLRPIAHSFAPIVRDDYQGLQKLAKFLKSLPSNDENKSISVLNESHEMNAGIIKTLIRESNIKNLKVLPVGGIDFRDDPGLNRIANSDYLILSDPFVGIIPGYQKLLLASNRAYTQISFDPNVYIKIYESKFGRNNLDPNFIWWDNQYSKASTNISIFMKKSSIPYKTQETMGLSILMEQYAHAKNMPSIQLAAGSISSKGSDPYSSESVQLMLDSDNSRGTILWLKKDLSIKSNCPIRVKIDGEGPVTGTLLRFNKKSTYLAQIIRIEAINDRECIAKIYPTS
jgi:hypothetical protein